MGFFNKIVKKGIQSRVSSSRTPILDVCVTRWVENIDGWERFSLCHPFLIEFFEGIVMVTLLKSLQNIGMAGLQKTKRMP